MSAEKKTAFDIPGYDKLIDNLVANMDDAICKSRIYKCTCGFIGTEEKALDHQTVCDNPMELIS